MNTLRKHRLVVVLLSVLAVVASACGPAEDPDLGASAPVLTETTLGSSEPVASDDALSDPDPIDAEPVDDADGDDTVDGLNIDDTEEVIETEDSTDESKDSTQAVANTLGSSLLAETFAEDAEVSTARFEGGIFMVGREGSELPGELALTFFGAYDLENNSSDITMDFSGILAALEGQEDAEELALFGEFFADPLRVVQIGDKAYVNWSLLSLVTGESDVWLETSAEESGAITEGFGVGGGSSPTAILDDLRDANATIEELGTENLRGVDTTHYRALINTEELAATMTPAERAEFEAELGGVSTEFPMDFWIDGDGLVRKFSLDLSGSLIDDPDLESARMEFEMFDYGADVDIQAPPADQILTEDELGFEFGS